jgi:hypothetical protein
MADEPERALSAKDLADRPAGYLVRQHARAAHASAPIRSFLARLMNVHTDERAWRLGAMGEELVGAELAKLTARDPRWRVLHSIPVGRNGVDIDHLVIGPGGVFALNTKHHPRARIWVRGDTILVNGASRPYVRNSRHEAERVARLLTAQCGCPVTARGVVVAVNASDITVKKTPDDVHVLGRRRLRRWLRRRPEVLDEPRVHAIYERARLMTTWS